jgi:hypothetical protein
MRASIYEEALFGRFANDDARPPAPNVIEVAKNIIGRENFRSDSRGYYVWGMGRWNGPLKLDGLMRTANERLKERGEAQIVTNPSWGV